jgi:lysophospholipase L1-like esterase
VFSRKDYGAAAIGRAEEIRLAARGQISTASRGKWYDKVSNGTDVDVTYRSMHEALCDFHGIRLMYGNFYNDGRTTNLSAYTINVSIDVDGVTYPVFFDNGATNKTVKLGARVLSDEIMIHVKKKTRFFVRTHVTVGVGEKYPVGLTLAGGSNNGEGIMPGDVTAGTFTSTTPNPLFALTPLSIYAKPSRLHDFKTVGLCGDSISVGAGHTVNSVDGRLAGEVGFLQIGAMRAGWGYVSIGMNGQRASDFVDPSKRLNQLQMAKDCDFVIVEYGTNDLSVANKTFEQLKTDLLTIHQTYWSMGIPTAQTTIAPRTNSTDGWSTLENQTPINANTVGGESSVRSRINNWIRNNTDGIRCIEIADIWESSRNSGLWAVSPKHTTDGIHPNNYGHDNAAANAVRDFLLRQ